MIGDTSAAGSPLKKYVEVMRYVKALTPRGGLWQNARSVCLAARDLGMTMPKPTLLMVGCGWMGRPYLSRAHRRGLKVAVLDSAEAFTWPETQAALGPDDQCYPVPVTNDEGWLVAASAALRDGPVVGVVAFSEPHVKPAALLCDEAGLPGPGLRAVLTSRSKLVQRELFGRRGLAQPEFHLAHSVEDAAAWSDGRFPVVVKPLSNMGSMGVQTVADRADIQAWFDGNDAPTCFLVEEYLRGPEYSVEAIVAEGEIAFWSVTEKVTTEAPYFVELEHHVPARVTAAEQAAAGATLWGVADALGMRSGIMHLELRLESTGPQIMEVAVRTPGDYIMDVVEAATGADLFDAVIAVACGQPPAVAVRAAYAASVWFPAPEPGTVIAVRGVEQIQRMDGVVNIEIDVGPGSEIHPLRSSMDRVGMVICRAPDRSELADLKKRVQDELVISVAPEG